MMTSKKQESILILTHDLKLNRTFTSRYFSFIRLLKTRNHLVKGVGIDFTFKPHPINNLDKIEEELDIEQDIITIRTKRLNLVQKLLNFSDRNNFPFSLKKGLLALHLIIYRTDQWIVNVEDFGELTKYKPTIIIAGGAGGIAETAFLLAKKFNAKLFIDYRDPWNFGYHPMQTNRLITVFKKRFTIARELRLLKLADGIITVSDSLKLFFPQKFQNKISVIENGSNFEEEEIINTIPQKLNFFNIVYLGTIYDDQLIDKSFFESLETFIEKNQLTPKNIRLSFLGSSQNELLPEVLHGLNLKDFTKITNRLSREGLRNEIRLASLFLQLKHGDRTKVITSKQADYLMFRKPILLPNTDNGDIAQSIVANNAGYVCDGNVATIVNVLQLEYDKFLRGESNLLENRDFSFLSRSKIAEKLLEIIP